MRILHLLLLYLQLGHSSIKESEESCQDKPGCLVQKTLRCPQNKEGFEREMRISTISNHFVPRSFPILTDEETNSDLLLLLVSDSKDLTWHQSRISLFRAHSVMSFFYRSSS